jgi:hypothetical protein
MTPRWFFMNSLIVHILFVDGDLQVYINGSITPMSRAGPRMISLKYAFDIELCVADRAYIVSR